ncbi:hypothetical protein HZC00_00780 [Candidatus Kaiserbacteria bacterium]|nr:hypothetical protein [Candidatus Kaiserbacteria bacterium]
MNLSRLKQRVVALRQAGKTYGEIQLITGKSIPKSTLSYWCKNYPLSKVHLNRVEQIISRGGEKGRAVALASKRVQRNQYIDDLRLKNAHLPNLLLQNIHNAKIALAILYLAEGGKHQSGSMMFGNSDPNIISLFLKLLHVVYDKIEDSKFRCTVQCRADQDIKSLERFWSRLTNIPLSQFYKARIDARTVGKISRKKDYKGVCRIDYFSAHVYNDLLVAGKVISGNM